MVENASRGEEDPVQRKAEKGPAAGQEGEEGKDFEKGKGSKKNRFF